MKSWPVRVRQMLIPILIGPSVWLLFHSLLYVGYVPAQSTSMEPTIQAGSLIFGLRTFGNLDRGDIVIFTKDSSFLVKRVYALEGDTVYISSAVEVSLQCASFVPARVLQVPRGSIFVVGDNSEASFDSRKWEQPFVNLDSVCAKVLFAL